jgi:hypothetical protein
LAGAVAASAGAAEETAPAKGLTAELGFEAGARILTGGGPYFGVLFHLRPGRFARVGIGFGYYELTSACTPYGTRSYFDVSGKPVFVSAEAVWPGMAFTPKLHLEVGAVSFSYSYYHRQTRSPPRYGRTDLFASLAPGVEFALGPRVYMTCEGGYGYQFHDFSSDTSDSPFSYGLFELGIRVVL